MFILSFIDLYSCKIADESNTFHDRYYSMKRVQIRSFFWSVFSFIPVFGLNTEIYGVNLRIQSEYRKIPTRKNSVFWHLPRSVYTMPRYDIKFECFLQIETLFYENNAWKISFKTWQATQPTFTCCKSTVDLLENMLNMFKVNKNIRTTPLVSLWCYYCYLQHISDL